MITFLQNGEVRAELEEKFCEFTETLPKQIKSSSDFSHASALFISPKIADLYP